MPGDHDHRQFGVQALDHVEQLQAVHAPAAHPDVEHDKRRLAGADGRQGALGILRRAHLIAVVFEDRGHQFTDIGLVVDDEHIAGHACTFRTSLRPVPALAIGNDSITRAPGPATASKS